MSSKEDEKGSSKYGEKEGDEKIDFHHEGKDGAGDGLRDAPKVDVTDIVIIPGEKAPLGDPLSLTINFTLDRDVVAAYWVFKTNKRYHDISTVLGETRVEDFPDGESDITFSVDEIDVSAIPPSTLANSGLLMACLMVDGAEVASVNMVVNVTEERGRVYREIYNPLA